MALFMSRYKVAQRRLTITRNILQAAIAIKNGSSKPALHFCYYTARQ